MTLIDQINAVVPLPRFVIVILLAIGAHLVAVAARWLFLRAGQAVGEARLSKVRTVVHLASGITVFAIYFFAIGLILAELGISITAYLATASVIGLAVGFGSQNIVQDVITGLTVILTDLVQIGDMVEITGQTGIVRSIGMRFTVLQNSMGAIVYIPNRTLASMISYPRGYVRCLVDVELIGTDAQNAEIEVLAGQMTQSVAEQFPAVLRAPIEVEERRQTASGKTFLRIKFRIWPGRGTIFETTFRQDLLARLKQIIPDYADFRVSVNYEVDQRQPPRPRSERLSR